MCVIIKQNNKEIKLKRLKHFNSHIHKRLFCDSKLNVWYKPKGEDLKPIGLEELDSLSELYPSSIRHIYQLKDFYRFTTGNSLSIDSCKPVVKEHRAIIPPRTFEVTPDETRSAIEPTEYYKKDNPINVDAD